MTSLVNITCEVAYSGPAQALYGVFGIQLLRLENFLPLGRLHDGVLSLPRCIHYQKAIDDFPVNDFGWHFLLLSARCHALLGRRGALLKE